MRNRIISIFMCIFMIFSLLTQNMNVMALEEPPKTVTITYESKEIDNLMLSQNERKQILAKVNDLENIKYQWQILVDMQTDKWVDIYKQNKKDIEISYAMFASVIDNANGAYIRCGITTGKETIYSNPVCITISKTPNIPFKVEEQVKSQKIDVLRKIVAVAETDLAYIKIHYKDAITGNTLYSSYISQVEKNKPFHQNVMSPTFLGFAPYYNKDELAESDANKANDDANEVTINFDSVDNDIEINVYYKAIEVPYSARYYFQNIYDDLYTENSALYFTGKALTGTIIDDNVLYDHVKNETKGFTPLYHYPESVAADGSTVFECYYDRNYYLMKFDMDGGFGVEPIYARYGTPFIVNKPTRPGYKFIGWDKLDVDSNNDGIVDKGDGKADVLPTQIPNESLSYKALWESGDTKVTYVYWRENPNDTDYSYWFDRQETVQLGQTLNGTDDANEYRQTDDTKDYFVFDHADTNIKVNNDGTTIINIYYKRKQYSVKFYLMMKDKNENYYVSIPPNNGKAPSSYANSGVFNTKINDSNIAQSWLSGTDIKEEKNDNGNTYYYLEIIAKYNQRIVTHWPVEGAYLDNPEIPPRSNNIENNYFLNWQAESGSNYVLENKNVTVIQGPYELMSDKLINKPKENIGSSLIMSCGDGTEKKLETWYEFQTLTGGNEVLYKYTFPSGLGNGQQLGVDFEGFITPSTSSGNPLIFHYDRDSSKFVKIFNNGEEVYNKSRLYGASLSDFSNYQSWVDNGTIKYPSNLEPNAYKFAGFYTTPNCISGTEIKETATMPANDILLYTKWIPVQHNVKFFNTYQDMLNYQINGNQNLVLYTQDLDHRSFVSNVPNTTPPNDEYVFNGWFYTNNGVKTAYTPLDIPIVKDMNIFADWSSTNVQPYLIEYRLKETGEKVADDTKGYGYQGSTRTFVPKIGNPYNQLYELYNNGYFPTVGSHSITLQEDNKDDIQVNKFVFEYVKQNEMSYKVRYVDKITGTTLIPDKDLTTSNAIVTERFEPITGYVPDAFYKRLIVSLNEDENVITFYYTQDDTKAFYAVHHMLQKQGTTGDNNEIDGTGDYYESNSLIEGVADVNNELSITPQTFVGYELAEDKAKAVLLPDTISNTLTYTNGNYTFSVDKNGTELYIFYTIKKCQYTVRYLNYNTQEELLNEKESSAEYGTIVTEKFEPIEGYNVVGDTTQTITIHENIDSNIITFYYVPIQYTVEYKVWEKGGGTVSKSIETILGNGELDGSTPTPDSGFVFDGWYSDKECTNPVNSTWVEMGENRLTPEKAQLQSIPKTNVFYAKFVSSLTNSITIEREKSHNEGYGNQVFVYKITKEDDSTFSMTVTVTGNSSRIITGLTNGKYIVEQLNDWSWRFKDGIKSVELTDDAKSATVTFNDDDDKKQWLNGNSEVKYNGGQTHENQQ